MYPNREGVPARVQRRVSAPDPFGYKNMVPLVEAVFDSATVEIRRGCTRGCRYGREREGVWPRRREREGEGGLEEDRVERGAGGGGVWRGSMQSEVEWGKRGGGGKARWRAEREVEGENGALGRS